MEFTLDFLSVFSSLEIYAFPYLLFIIGDLEISKVYYKISIYHCIIFKIISSWGKKQCVVFKYKANLNLNGGIAINSVVIRK